MNRDTRDALIACGVFGAIGGFVGDWLWAAAICTALGGIFMSLSGMILQKSENEGQ